MDKKKLIATLAAISLSVGMGGLTAACGDGEEPPHSHTFDTTQWVTDGGDTHWHPSTCGHDVKDGEEGHADEDGNKFCDKCEKDMRKTIAVTVAPTTGGSVTLDKTAPKEGETVTVTVTPDKGYNISSVKLGTEDKTLDENNKFTFTANAAITVTATFETKTITLDASTLNSEQGEVVFKYTGDKTEYKFGENVVLNVTAKGYYKLSALYINGGQVNYADNVSDEGDLILTNFREESITVTATFVIGYKDIDVTFAGKRMGSDVVFGADSEIAVGGYDEVTLNAEGKASLIKAEIGKSYTVSAAGYKNGTFTVGDDDTYNVVLQWRAYDAYPDNESNRDVSHFNDGYITATTAKSDIFIYTEKFIGDNAVFTTTFKSSIFAADADTNRSYVGFMFGDKLPGDASSGLSTWFNKNVMVHLINDANNRRMEWMGAAEFHHSGAINTEWKVKHNAEDNSGFYDHLPQSVLDKWDGDGVELTIVRKDGKYIYAFVDGLYVGQCDIGEEYVGQLAAPAIVAPQTKNGYVLPFVLSEGATAVNEYMTATGAVATGSVLNGITVVSNKTGEVELMEQVELTVTVPAGKKITSFEVDGVDAKNSLVFKEVGTENSEVFTYSFLKRKCESKGTIVNAVTEDVVLVNLDATIKSKKLGVTAKFPEDTVVKFKGSRYTLNVDANGKISQTAMAAGTYTVSVDGYIDRVITIDSDSATADIVLEYDLFKIVRWDTEGHDLSHVNDADGYVAFTGPGASLNVVSKEKLFGDVAVTVKLLGSNTTDGENRQGVILQFEDGKAAILNINTSGTLRLQHQPGLFTDDNDPSIGLHTVFPKKSDGGDNWHEYTNVTQEEVNKYNSSTGIELKIVRRGNVLYTFLGDVYKGKAELPEEYADDMVGFGLFSFGAKAGCRYDFTVSTDLDVNSIEDTTATDAKGNIKLDKTTGVKLGDVVTVTVAPADGFALYTLTVVGGTNVVRVSETTFTFVASKSAITVNATFSAPVDVMAAVSAKGLNNSDVNLIGKTLVFTPEIGTATNIVIGNNGVVTGKLLPGKYTVSVDETKTPYRAAFKTYYDLEVEVNENGFVGLENGLRFVRRLFQTNAISEPENNIFGDNNPVNWSADNTAAATEGIIKSTKAGKMYEWTLDSYGDVAFTVTLKSGNGNQGIVMRFGGEQKDVRLRFEKTKAQWLGGGWWWGTNCINGTWDFGNGEEFANPMNSKLLEKYDGDGLKLTMLRKGVMVYALIDGKIYAAQRLGAEYAGKEVIIAYFAEDSKAGYNVPFTIDTDTDAVFASAGVAAGTDVKTYLGKWTENNGTLAFSSNAGYAEFNAPENTLKESATIHIKDDVGNEPGLMYRFANGKYIAVRYQLEAKGHKVQYTMDTPLFNENSLRGWVDYFMNDAEKETFLESGLDLRFVRDGKVFYTLLGDRVVDVATLDDEYATMKGVMGMIMWGGKGGAFAYSHVTGDEAIPSVVNVTLTAGETHGYDVSVDRTRVKSGGNVTLTIKTGSNWGSAWSWFPTSVMVNDEEKFVAAEMVSNGANRLTYTLTIENVTADPNIVVTIAKGTVITNGVLVTVAGETGGTAVSDSGADGYYWNDGCDIHITPAEGFEIASISYKRRADEGDPTVVTEGWTEVTGKDYTYSYTLPISITEPTDVVVTFRAVAES